MIRSMHRSLCIAVALTAAIGLAACGDSSEELQEHLDRALDYRDAGDMRAAVIELKNVLQIDPEHAEARWLLGRTFIALGDAHGHFLAFVQGFAATAVDGTVVDKYVLATGLFNKTKTFFIIEPLNGTFNLI